MTTVARNSASWARRVAAIASLGDETRRHLFDHVAAASGPVSRDDAAGALGLPRSTASFQLDRLVRDGLLAVEFRKLGGKAGPGSGRPAKLYRPAVPEVSVSIPERNYDLAAELLATAVEESSTGAGGAREVLLHTAYARGLAVAGAGPGRAGFADVLTAEGYQPTDDGDGGLVLLNCPFHRLAQGHTGVVCAMNGAFLGGVAAACGVASDRVEALDIMALRACGEAGSAQCCARIRPV